MFLEIRPSSKTPIYEQIKEQIIYGIASGQLKSGEGLPSVRALATDLGVNLHTVNKAYRELEEAGFLILERSAGTRVRDEIRSLTEEEYESGVDALTNSLAFLKAKDLKRNQLENLLEELLDEMEG